MKREDDPGFPLVPACVLAALTWGLVSGLTACNEPEEVHVHRLEMIATPQWLADSVTTIHDCKRHATCWVTLGSGSAGISCLPDSQLANEAGKCP
jgi:hypothetical protein